MSKAAFSLYTALLLERAAGFTTNPVALSCEGLVSPPLPLRGGDRRQRRVLGLMELPCGPAHCHLRWLCSCSVCALLCPPNRQQLWLLLFGLGALSLVAASAWTQGWQQTHPCELKMEPQDCTVASLLLCSPGHVGLGLFIWMWVSGMGTSNEERCVLRGGALGLGEPRSPCKSVWRGHPLATWSIA